MQSLSLFFSVAQLRWEYFDSTHLKAQLQLLADARRKYFSYGITFVKLNLSSTRDTAKDL